MSNWLFANNFNVADALFHPVTRGISMVAMAVSFVFPIEGLGIDLCVFHATTGLPCPGCGLTRGISAFSQLQFLTALGFHPFVLLLWPTFAAVALFTLLPKSLRLRIEESVRASRGASVIYKLAIMLFVIFGVLRLCYFALRNERF